PLHEIARRYSAALLPGLGVMAIALGAILPVRLARRLGLPALFAALVTLAGFALSPPAMPEKSVVAYFHALGASGLFLAIVLGLVTCGAMTLARRIIRPETLADAVAGAVVVGLCALSFLLHASLANAIAALLHPLTFLGDTFSALVLITLVETLLWTAGIHGPATLAAVVTPIYLVLQQQNATAFSEHAALPHIVTVSTFLFVFPGGAGATFPLMLMLATSRVGRLRKVGRIGLVPAIFNINEPLIFGVPIVFNPFLSVPFVLAPAVLSGVTYAAMRLGLVDRPSAYIPSMVPSVIATYLATLDWRAVVLVGFNLLISAAIYLPFFRAFERYEAAR
ncbi:MAG: PTS sugar transporter subunit IIC, partial [Candidatus Eremiobacteraeota bacterium]|nr:PTS sugar transporter subunit IIC [Candidatus Eremiobacteraeota bacterium]